MNTLLNAHNIKYYCTEYANENCRKKINNCHQTILKTKILNVVEIT